MFLTTPVLQRVLASNGLAPEELSRKELLHTFPERRRRKALIS
jgi:hypothetical protein